MRAGKLFFASFFTGTLLFGVLGASGLSAQEQKNEALRFRDDGTFKIVVLADTQGINHPSRNMLRLINDVLDEEKPDLVVMTGDQIKGYDPTYHIGNKEKRVRQGIEAVVSPMVERGLPFAVVFGNHDQEALEKEAQMKIYQSYPGCLAVDEGDALPGCGTYSLPVRSHDGTRDAMNLYLVDSMAGALKGGYENVSPEQIDWCKQAGEALKAANGGQPVPAVLFQHIAVPEVYDMFSQVGEGTPGAVKGYRVHEGYYIANPAFVRDGALMEGPCPPDTNNGQFQAWRDAGDIFAAVFGHDHVNSFLGNYEGIDLCAAPGCTFDSYGSRDAIGIRTMTFHEDSVKNYETHVTTFMDQYGRSFGTYLRYYLDTPGDFPTYGYVLAVLLIGGLTAAVAIPVHIHRKKKKGEHV